MLANRPDYKAQKNTKSCNPNPEERLCPTFLRRGKVLARLQQKQGSLFVLLEISHLGNVHVDSTRLLVLGEEDVHSGLRQRGQPDVKLLSLPFVARLQLRCGLEK
jgi:hypothetical protein